MHEGTNDFDAIFDSEAGAEENRNEFGIHYLRHKFPTAKLDWVESLGPSQRSEFGWFCGQVEFIEQTIPQLEWFLSESKKRGYTTEEQKLLLQSVKTLRSLMRLTEEFVALGTDSRTIRTTILEGFEMVELSVKPLRVKKK